MKTKLVVLGQLIFLAVSIGFLSGCSANEPKVTAEELIESGCANYQSAEGLEYFRQAANIDEKYRGLVQSVSALQINLKLIENDSVAAEVKRTIALKMIEDLAIKNSFCR